MKRYVPLAAAALMLVGSACGSASPRKGAAPAPPSRVPSSASPVSSGQSSVAASMAGPGAPSLDALFFQSARLGFAGGLGVLLRTTDGGAHWSAAARPASAVTDFSFPSASSGFAVTRNGLLVTRDGGATWKAAHEPSGKTSCLEAPSSPCIQNATFPTASTGYAVGAISPQVGTDPAGLALSADGSHLFVANGSGTLTIYNRNTGTIDSVVKLGGGPTAVAASHGKVYVSDQTGSGSGAVTVIDGASGTVLKTLKTTSNPCAIAVSPDGSALLVAGDALQIIDLASGRTVGTIPVQSGSCTVAVGPKGRTAYATGNSGHQVLVVDVATQKIVHRIPAGKAPSGLLLSPDGSRLFVSDALGGSVTAYDTSSLKKAGSAKVGPLSYGMAVSPDGTMLYVLSSGGRLDAIDTHGLTVKKTLNVPQDGYHLALAPDGKALFLTAVPDHVLRVNTATWAVTPIAADGVPVRSDSGRPIPQHGLLFKTTDGGASWQPLKPPGPVQSACFSSARSGYIADQAKVWHTSDGGRTWHLAFTAPLAQQGGPGDVTADIRCQGKAAWLLLLGTGAAMGHAPYVAFGTSDGSRWKPLIEENYTHMGARGVDAPEGPGSEPGPYTITPGGQPVFGGGLPGFSTAGLAVLTGGKGASITVPGLVQLSALSFVTPKEGWVVGGYGQSSVDILHTSDGGKSWTLQWPVDGNAPLRGISFVSEQVGYGVGTPGNENAVLKTTDGGKTWTQIASLNSPSKPYPSFPGIQFLSSSVGYAVNAAGSLMKSTDGGKTWAAVSGAPGAIASMAFVTEKEGCVALIAGGMKSTSDGGATWKVAAKGPVQEGVLGCAVSLKGPAFAAAVRHLETAVKGAGVAAYLAPKTLWAITPQALMRSDDGSVHWTEMPLDPNLPALGSDIDFVNLRTGYMLTQEGGLLKTADGGSHWLAVR